MDRQIDGKRRVDREREREREREIEGERGMQVASTAVW